MDSDTKLTAKYTTDAKQRQIQRLRDPNPMDDIPTQDSTKNQENI